MNTTSNSWVGLREFYEGLGETTTLRVAPILELLEWIKNNGVEDEIAAHTSMHDLILSLEPQPGQMDGEIRISIGTSEQVSFTYSRHRAATDSMKKEVHASEACETLRQFLAYKLGIYRRTE